MSFTAAQARWAAAKVNRELSSNVGDAATDTNGAQAAFERAEAKVATLEWEVHMGAATGLTADDALESRFAMLVEDAAAAAAAPAARQDGNSNRRDKPFEK